MAYKFQLGNARLSGSIVQEGDIFVSGSDTVDIVAGLTNISPTTLNTDSGTNWSGSVGVG